MERLRGRDFVGNGYRNPGQLPDGAVLIVGTGQSGGQIAEELLAVGREIHLAVSTCRKHRAGTAARTSSIG